MTAGLCAGVSPASASDDKRNLYKALVFTKAEGEKHASTAAGADAIKALGLKHRFVVQTTDRAQRFNDEDLSSYRVVVFLNTSGDVLTDGRDDLVAGHDRHPRAADLAVDDVQVGPAHAACPHAQKELARTGLGQRSLRKTKRATGSVEHHRLHTARMPGPCALRDRSA